MLKNGQTNLKNVNITRFLKYVWPFFNVMRERDIYWLLCNTNSTMAITLSVSHILLFTS